MGYYQWRPLCNAVWMAVAPSSVEVLDVGIALLPQQRHLRALFLCGL